MGNEIDPVTGSGVCPAWIWLVEKDHSSVIEDSYLEFALRVDP